MREETDIGYERILSYLRECQKACPKGVSIKRTKKGNSSYLSLQMRVGEKRIERTLELSCTMQGITEAATKAVQVAEILKTLKTETEFLAWYDKAILRKNAIANNLMTFGEAIAKIEQEYWAGTDKNHRQRDCISVSQQATYISVYGRFFNLLPASHQFNAGVLVDALYTKETGTKVFGDCLYAFKRLSAIAGNEDAIAQLDKIKHTQTKFRTLQNAELDTLLTWMKECLDGGKERYKVRRQQWCWVFSMQLLYGFRVHEVFAIANIDKSFKTKDGVTLPALQDLNNKKMIAVVGTFTVYGTTTKTGYRLVSPMPPPSHPNLIEELNIRSKFGGLPELNIVSDNPKVIADKYNHSAREALVRWKAPITQTHALRHLCNQNGKQSGISAEDRAANLGHSLAMNTSTYLKREATSTRLAAIDAMSGGKILPLEGAIAVMKRIGVTDETVALLAEIYGVGIEEVIGNRSYLSSSQKFLYKGIGL